MNNLKFRAWDKTKEIFTNYQIVDDMLYFMDKFTGVWKRDDNQDRFVLMQSTGYKDKKGTEIFIGDIVKIYIEDREDYKVYYSLCKVVFDEEILTTRLEIIERFCDMLMPAKYLYFKNVEDIVIAGNIYENKELLRK
ncbi:YopX family protein [uncultured Parvimonas sp.]|jgi:hypothetical protein F3_00892|uniref:YopX family protein n=1 Tax=uncultured Parvimonas sp. TaxID=747372 RepID=UPI00325FB37E